MSHPLLPNAGLPEHLIRNIEATFPEPDKHGAMNRMMPAFQALQQSIAMESTIPQQQLLDIAIQVVSHAFPLSTMPNGLVFDDIKWDLGIVPFNPTSISELKADTIPVRIPQVNISLEDQVALDKRRVINLLTQGFALNARSEMFTPGAEQALEQLPEGWLNTTLTMVRLALEQMQQMGMDNIEDMLEEDGEMPTSVVEVTWENEEPVIYARSVNLERLIHEMVKGVYELISLHGMVTLKGNVATQQLLQQQADTKYDEAAGFLYGPAVAAEWEKAYHAAEMTLIRRHILSGKDVSVRATVLAYLYRLEDASFLKVMHAMFHGEQAPRWVLDYVEEVIAYVVENTTDEPELHIPELTLDELLEKVNRVGFDGLTTEEKELLTTLAE